MLSDIPIIFIRLKFAKLLPTYIENLSWEVGRSCILYSAVQDLGLSRTEETESDPDGCRAVSDSKESLDL